jgi:hypothetical protein
MAHDLPIHRLHDEGEIMKHAVCVCCITMSMLGCAPAQVFQLIPQDSNVRWLQGQQIIRRDSNGVAFIASFNRTWGTYLVIDVEVVNGSDTTFLLDPSVFYYRLSVSRGAHEAGLAQRFPAMNPERELARLDKLTSRTVANHQTLTVLNSVAEVADLALDIAEAGDRTKEEQHRDAEEDYRRTVDRHLEQREYEGRITNLSQLRDYWSSSILRKTHVGPGESASGKIALPAMPVAEFMDGRLQSDSTSRIRRKFIQCTYALALHCPVAGTVHRLDFEVKKL